MLSLVISIALTHGIDPNLFQAILWQESRMEYAAVSRTGDVGIAQISPGLAKAYGWDRERLRIDLRYNLECSAKFLSDLKRKYGKREPKHWYTRYHSQNDVLRFRYKLAVGRFLK